MHQALLVDSTGVWSLPSLFLPNPSPQGPIAATWEGRVREGPFLEASTGRPGPLEEGRRPQPGSAAGQMEGGIYLGGGEVGLGALGAQLGRALRCSPPLPRVLKLPT